MKTKVILLIAVSAIATLSFTIVSVNKQTPVATEAKASQEPVGGLLSEEKL
jgi:hypothetical protein